MLYVFKSLHFSNVYAALEQFSRNKNAGKVNQIKLVDVTPAAALCIIRELKNIPIIFTCNVALEAIEAILRGIDSYRSLTILIDGDITDAVNQDLTALCRNNRCINKAVPLLGYDILTDLPKQVLVIEAAVFNPPKPSLGASEITQKSPKLNSVLVPEQKPKLTKMEEAAVLPKNHPPVFGSPPPFQKPNAVLPSNGISQLSPGYGD